ncbi:hypothetical protein CEXT_267561 [Caerostris extrusa]|uniref:Uncharacterized protein n=1 Tax=Caerostris extrusa TaxID=172846 RepID=A0AAV4QDZ7_CAEEX|nr:hypothetical protein CEXT_267561 [Caerostris extrusa]
MACLANHSSPKTKQKRDRKTLKIFINTSLTQFRRRQILGMILLQSIHPSLSPPGPGRALPRRPLGCSTGSTLLLFLGSLARACVRVEHGEVGYDDGHGQCNGQHTSKCTQGTHEHARVGLGDHVAVAHSGHSDQGPPESQGGDAGEVVVGVGLDPLRVVDERRR